jgi:hypothetical protein
MQNPIDKDKVAENPGLLAYPHTIGSVVVKPEDNGKLKTRALSAMHEQTSAQLKQIQKQVETLLVQANDIKRRVEVSEKVYQAEMRFEPFVGKIYHLYEKEGKYQLLLIGPDEWGMSNKNNLNFVSTVKLLSDHTWEVLDNLGY